jgi:hypothetical protein
MNHLESAQVADPQSAAAITPPATDNFPRRSGETPRAFSAFSAFFQLGQTRSVQAVAGPAPAGRLALGNPTASPLRLVGTRVDAIKILFYVIGCHPMSSDVISVAAGTGGAEFDSDAVVRRTRLIAGVCSSCRNGFHSRNGTVLLI